MQVVLSSILILLIAAPAWAAIAEVGAGSQRATASENGLEDTRDLAFPGDVTANNLAFVGGRCWNIPVPATVAVNDTRGTSYQIFSVSALDGDDRVRVFVAIGIIPSSGPNTVTVDCSGSAAHMYAVDEFSGVDVVTPLDVDPGGAIGGVDTTATRDITTATSNAMILACESTDTGAATVTLTPAGGWTQIGEDENKFYDFNCVFKIVTTATTYTVSWTLGSAENWGVYAISVKPGAAPASTPVRTVGGGVGNSGVID